MLDIRSVFIGNFSLSGKKVYSLKNYSQFYNELVTYTDTGKIDVFAGYYLPDDPGFEFSFDQQLSDKIKLTLSRGNSSTTKLLPFIWNNLVLFIKLTAFCLKKGNYFIFLPSPIGVWSILVLTLFRKNKSLGIYIGGYYGREQLFEKRKGYIKKKIKRLSAFIVDRLVVYAIKKADYVITSSYEYLHFYNATGKVFLTPPMLNVDAADLDIVFEKRGEKYITFCGELRHPKGILDLANAFVRLAKERRNAGYKLRIIGDGQAMIELRHLLKENGIEELVVFDGQIKDKKELKEAIGKSSIFVLPSYSEGFPRVAYESFTLGVPTILTPVGGIPYFVNDKVHCLLTPPGNIDELVNNIEKLINDKELQVRLSSNSKKLMSETVFARIKADKSLARMIIREINKVRSK